MRQYTIVAFDVSSDTKRAAVVKALKAVSVRLQRSVFEASALDEAPFLRLRSDLEGLVDPATADLIRARAG